jgi:hypothetical protein
MSEARFGREMHSGDHVQRAIDHLSEAQAIIDTLDRPDIGARLEQVMDSLREIQRG